MRSGVFCFISELSDDEEATASLKVRGQDRVCTGSSILGYQSIS